MKTKFNVVCIIASTVLLVLFFLFAIKNKSCPDSETINNNSKEWKFLFQRKKIVLLHVRRDTLTTCFNYYNYTNKIQAIDTVLTSCGCTSVKYSHKPIKPHESGKLIISIILYMKESYFSKSIVVYFHAHTPVILRVSGKKDAG
jgi:hypothetical protein